MQDSRVGAGGDDAWQGPDRLREAEWHGANREEGRNFAPSDGQGIPPGPNMRGKLILNIAHMLAFKVRRDELGSPFFLNS